MYKNQDPKNKKVSTIKSTPIKVSKSADTTRTVYPKQVSKSGATSQLTKIEVNKRKKIK
jgi:hypothetical protein